MLHNRQCHKPETDAAAERGRVELEACERDRRTKLNGLNAAVADEARIEALAAVSVMRQGLEEPGASVMPEGVEAPRRRTLHPPRWSMLTVTPLGPLLRRRTATWLAMRQVHGVARTASLRVRDRQGPLALRVR